MAQGVNRRAFSKTAVAAATVATAASLAPGRVLGANERVRLGFIGVGNRGCQLLKGFLAACRTPRSSPCATCTSPICTGPMTGIDPRFAGLGKRIAQMPTIEGDVARVKDFRTVLDRKDIDAVVIATPDHWHAIQMIAACRGGQGRLRREAAVDDDRRGPAPWSTRRGSTTGSSRSAPPPLVADVRPARRGGAVRARWARSRWRGRRSPAT